MFRIAGVWSGDVCLVENGVAVLSGLFVVPRRFLWGSFLEFLQMHALCLTRLGTTGMQHECCYDYVRAV